MRIHGTTAAITREEISRHVNLAALPPGTEVRAYVIGYEGESRPINADTGRVRPLQWGRAVIRRLADLAHRGVKFVRSHADRSEVGEVLGGWTDEVAGRLRAIVAGAFPPGAADDQDICSIEADGVHDHGTGVVMDIGRLTGIALANSRTETPGMPGARLLGAIHAFSTPAGAPGGGVDSPVPVSHDPANMADGTQATQTVTLRVIKDWLSDNPGVLPGQLFDDAAIEAHPSVQAKVADVSGKLTKAELKVTDLGLQIGRSKAKAAVDAGLDNWTVEARAFASAAFDGWPDATDNPAKVAEWIARTGERWKQASGAEAIKPAGDGDTPKAGDGDVSGDRDKQQPNDPPKGQDSDPVATAFEALGITRKKEAA